MSDTEERGVDATVRSKTTAVERQRRPDADELLARLRAEELRAKRGKLTVFFGAAPGVGKTYGMLEAARTERDLRRDVVVGVVESHGRYDTAALTIGLELLPRRKVEYRGLALEELDLDGTIARRPGLVLIDELAHTNAAGSRHAKRWQDVEELLDAGIDVYTTVNVQHIESLNDVVAQITGVIVRETVPDRIIENADEIRLIDLPPDDLLDRLEEGKVYVPEQARRAKTGFFKKGTLIALRELALRCTAARVDEQMRSQKRAEGVEHAWPVAERILVCVSPSPASARLLRATRRVASSLRAEWIAAYVETPLALRMSEADRERVAEHLQLAEQLGAETVRLSGEHPAEEVILYARTRNVTKIVVGKPTHPRWRDLIQRSFLEELVRGTPDIDVQVITGEDREGATPPSARPPPDNQRRSWAGFGAAALGVGIATTVSWLLFGHTELADVVMAYVFGIVLVAMRFGFGPSILAAVLSVLSLDFFFVPPYFSFSVTDLRHTVTFGVMFFVAAVISRLTHRIREQADTARERDLRSMRLYAMSRELAATSGIDEVLRIATKHLAEAFDAEVCVLLPDVDGRLATEPRAQASFVLARNDRGVIEWVWTHERTAGLGTDTLPSASARFLLLSGGRGKVGVLGVRPKQPSALVDPQRRQLLETFASQVANALERVMLSEEARRAAVEIETERLRSSLLSSVSHDLRTPLGVITGATSTLLEDEATLDPVTRRDLLETAHEEAERLNRLVRNLLDMTRLASGAIRPKKEWHLLEEVVGVALRRLEARLSGRTIDVRLPADLPPVPMDDVLIEQVFINLLENTIKYTPADSSIDIVARARDGAVEIEVADRGPGVPPAERDHVFEKFYRLDREGAQGGAGLGLAICRGLVEAHGGRIWVEDREGGGARFRFTLPIEGTPPVVAT
jgi:two-component system sensor histidine kinase KdpD